MNEDDEIDAKGAYDSFDTDDIKVTPNPTELDGVPDMSMLIYLEGPNIVHNLEVRYNKDQIYTAMSKVLIAVNPYHPIDQYKPKVIRKYHENQSGFNALPPHVFAVAAETYKGLLEKGKNQSMIVCGESGSGKTENAKYLMRHLAYTTPTANLTGDTEHDERIARGRRNSVSNMTQDMVIEQQILAANPILEAMGNAKTILNNNSSRFGKFTKMLFTLDAPNKGNIVGSYIETYLLEKSRVVVQPRMERNFHIFYQLFKGLPNETLKELHLTRAEEYHYTNQWNCCEIQGVSDRGRFQELVSGMNMLGMQEDVQSAVWRIIAGILHLGNITFGGDEEACIDDEKAIDALNISAELLGLDPERLRARLTTRTIRVPGKVIVKPLSINDVIVNRDSIAKGIFSGLFDWMVRTINRVLFDDKGNPETDDHYSSRGGGGYGDIDDDDDGGIRFIGILDVFGFECFLHNSFEQFCINYANERLQNFFNEHIIKSEQEEYLKEGIYWTPVEVPDNSDTIDLVRNKKTGIYSVLEAACNQPKGTDIVFTQNLFQAHPKHRRMHRERHASKKKNRSGQLEVINGFSIEHFAGKVIYNAKDFLVKNTDQTHNDTISLFYSSSTDIMKELLGAPDQKGKRRKKLPQSVGGVFARQLDSLMSHLQETYPYFVRCINPNDRKASHHYIPHYVEAQLRCGGIIEALRILKCGYPTRCSYESLWQRYGHLLKPKPSSINYRDFCEAILVAYGLGTEHYELGLTKVFFRPSKQSFLEEILKKNRFSLPPEMLARIKRYLNYKRLLRLAAVLKAFAKFSLVLRRKRAGSKLAHLVRVSVKVNNSFIKLLKFVRVRDASLAIQAAFRKYAHTSFTLIYFQSVVITQRWWRHQHRKNCLWREVERRIAEKRTIAEQKALEEEELRRLEQERREQERRNAAAKKRALRVVVHDELLPAIIGEIALWFSAILDGVIKDNMVLADFPTGVLLCRILKKLKPSLPLKVHLKANAGTFFARDNVTNFLTMLSKIGIDPSKICSVEDITNMFDEKVVLNTVLNLLWLVHSSQVFIPKHKSFRYQLMIDTCMNVPMTEGIAFFGVDGVFEEEYMDPDLLEQFLLGGKPKPKPKVADDYKHVADREEAELSSEQKALLAERFRDKERMKARRAKDSDEETEVVDKNKPVSKAVAAARERIRMKKKAQEKPDKGGKIEDDEEEEAESEEEEEDDDEQLTKKKTRSKKRKSKKKKRKKKKDRGSDDDSEEDEEKDEASDVSSEESSSSSSSELTDDSSSSSRRRRKKRRRKRRAKRRKRREEARKRREEKSGGSLVNPSDPMETFFCMTHAAVLTKLEEESKLDNVNMSTSKELYQLAKAQNVGWHEWHDWLRLQLSSVGDEMISEDEYSDYEEEMPFQLGRPGRSYSVDDMEMLDASSEQQQMEEASFDPEQRKRMTQELLTGSSNITSPDQRKSVNFAATPSELPPFPPRGGKPVSITRARTVLTTPYQQYQDMPPTLQRTATTPSQYQNMAPDDQQYQQGMQPTLQRTATTPLQYQDMAPGEFGQHQQQQFSPHQMRLRAATTNPYLAPGMGLPHHSGSAPHQRYQPGQQAPPPNMSRAYTTMDRHAMAKQRTHHAAGQPGQQEECLIL